MKIEETRVCILRVGGTNCDIETREAFQKSGAKAEIIHFNQLVKQRSLLDFNVLVIPGGFSYGDYVRAGAIWAKMLMAKLGNDIKRFVEEERPILGICNGFQVLIEAGLLPLFDGISPFPEAALGTNIPTGYNCRWVYLKHINHGSCVFTHKIPQNLVVRIPVAHSEGRFMFGEGKEEKCLEKLLENDQLVFRYCNPSGKFAHGEYPTNPNGAFFDIAGICDPSGKILGLMPHPERSFFNWQRPDWTGEGSLLVHSDGKLIFDSVVEYLRRRT